MGCTSYDDPPPPPPEFTVSSSAPARCVPRTLELQASVHFSRKQADWVRIAVQIDRMC